MINKVLLIGNVGRDPEVRKLESGASVAKFSVATNENYKDKAGEWQTVTEWHNIVAWRGLAERAERDIKKGSLVYVEGKLTTRKWQDKEGNDKYTTEVLALQLRSLEKRESNNLGNSGSFPTSADEFPTSKSAEATSTNPSPPAAKAQEDDDLPF